MRFSRPIAALSVALFALGTPTPSHAFDLEDYASTFRATRDAYNKALNEYRISLPYYLAIRQIAESYGLSMADQELNLGSALAPPECQSWQIERVGTTSSSTTGMPVHSGSFPGNAFYGRGHQLHQDGRGHGHHRYETAASPTAASETFLGLWGPLQWQEEIDPGSAEYTRQLVASDIAYFEANGVAAQHCYECVPCNHGEPCANTCLGGSWRVAATCPPTDTPPILTVAEALAYFETEGLTFATASVNQCVPEWWEMEPSEDIATTHRAYRDSLMKAANELNLATPPFRAATAGYAAAVESFLSNEPCGTWMLPNVPELPSPNTP